MKNKIYISPIFKLAKDIVKEGWLYGDTLSSSNPDREPNDRDKLGIYRIVEDTIEPWFFGLLKRKVSHMNPKIGVVWINDYQRHAYESSIWKLEVYGTQNIEALTKFMEKVCPVEFSASLASHDEYTYYQSDY